MPGTFGTWGLLPSPGGVRGNGVGSDPHLFRLGTWVKVVPLIAMGTRGGRCNARVRAVVIPIPHMWKPERGLAQR